jgi:hypothetical protein
MIVPSINQGPADQRNGHANANPIGGECLRTLPNSGFGWQLQCLALQQELFNGPLQQWNCVPK